MAAGRCDAKSDSARKRTWSACICARQNGKRS